MGVTDNKWYDFLSRLPDCDEVNFWQPSPTNAFKALKPGELFLFKLHSPYDYITGGGVFTSYTTLPLSLAWEAFKEKNGASSFQEMRAMILSKRNLPPDTREDFEIGCIILTQPFFLDRNLWFPPPEWSKSIQKGKGYGLDEEAGKFIWNKIQYLLEQKDIEAYRFKEIMDNSQRYGKEQIITPRLGQGTFKVCVTDAYHRSCAITGEKALPVLEAAHIKPYSESGPHLVKNGLLLRSDLHKLFDKGYMTVTTKLDIEVSRRIKEEFDNGEYYYTLHGKKMSHPTYLNDRPEKEFIEWHNEKVFRG
ncbi:MAG: HNH endonuclease [Elusimicrobiota bacterium]